MKVVNTTDTSHSIRFIPRIYSLDGTTLQLTNEANKEVTDITHTIVGTESILTLLFDYDFTEGDRFQIKLYNDNYDLYRGRILATNQEVQEYDTTKEYYTY